MNPLRVFIFFLFIVFSESTLAATAPAKILVVGDSLSAGFGIRIEQGWVHLLQQELAMQQARVINASVSSEASAGGRARLPALLRQHQPNIVILELGGNDGMRGQPLKMLEENLQAMLARIFHAVAEDEVGGIVVSRVNTGA